MIKIYLPKSVHKQVFLPFLPPTRSRPGPDHDSDGKHWTYRGIAQRHCYLLHSYTTVANHTFCSLCYNNFETEAKFLIPVAEKRRHFPSENWRALLASCCGSWCSRHTRKLASHVWAPSYSHKTSTDHVCSLSFALCLELLDASSHVTRPFASSCAPLDDTRVQWLAAVDASILSFSKRETSFSCKSTCPSSSTSFHSMFSRRTTAATRLFSLAK